MTFRTRSLLDGIWKFWPDPDYTFSFDNLPQSQAAQMPVPSAWQSQEAYRNYVGVAWYQIDFNISQSCASEQSIWLIFGAVEDRAEVWINGNFVGEHIGGYLPFELEISRFVHPGGNEITVRVEDAAENFEETPHGKQSWYGYLSGIWQSVYLEQRPHLHFQGVKISPQVHNVQITTTFNDALPLGYHLSCRVMDPLGDEVLHASVQTSHFQLVIDKPILWDVNSPNLYRLCLSMVNEQDVVLDEIEQTFGFRTIETHHGQIYLNGRSLYLRAALDQDYYPDGFCTPPSLEFIEAEFLKARTMGLNCLRIHIKVADPRYYEAADRLGMLIWTELPNWGILTPAARLRARQTLFGMVERDWNHPSIIIWTIMNESWGIDLSDPDQRAWLADTFFDLKSFDPHRLVVDNSACCGNFHIVTDLEDFHNYYAMPDHCEEWQDWVQNLASRPAWTFARDYQDKDTWTAFLKDPWHAPALPPAAEVRRTGNEPLLVSEFGNWGLPDVARLLTRFGAEPWWFDTGLSWGDGVVYPHGVQKRFEEYALGRAFRNMSDLANHSQQLQFSALQYQIGQMRRQPAIQGYVITEFSDVHWESNGLLDMQRNPKAYFEHLSWLNSDDFIGVDITQPAVFGGEPCCISVWLSHYSGKNITGSRVEWSLDERPCGQFEAPRLSHAEVWCDGEIILHLREVTEPMNVSLNVDWVAADGTRLAHNQYEILVFPHERNIPTISLWASPRLQPALESLGYRIVADRDQAKILLTDQLDDDLRSRLFDGARVLWLADHKDALQTSVANLGLKARQGTPWQGDWASSMSWINRDVLFKSLPGKNILDFTYRGLTPEFILTGFSPQEFFTRVHAGMFVGWLHKPVALIGERSIGRGQVLACTLNLADRLPYHPLAAYLMKDMITYLQ